MTEDSDLLSAGGSNLFRPFTRESLLTVKSRVAEENEKQKKLEKKETDGKTNDEDERPQPDSTLKQGAKLPLRMQRSFPPEMTSTLLEDIDPFYANQRTFVVVSRCKNIFRFSATDAMLLLDPINPIRRGSINILVHPLFSLFIMTTLLINYLFMIMPTTPMIESAELIFIGIYTFEAAVKVMARGFILSPFSYLRDQWHWLEFIILVLAYGSVGTGLGNFAALRTLRALQMLTVIPAVKPFVNAIVESVKNLRDLVILIMFSLSVFAVLGLQIYMGILTQKCIRKFPDDGSWGNLTDENWENFNQNQSNWDWDPILDDYLLCGNSSGAGTCDPEYICLAGYGHNPNYGYTNFDSYSWAFLSAFRLMTQDYWENLYQLVLRSAGPWHMLFFILAIFLGSICLVNFMIAIFVLSFGELQLNAEEEEAAEEEALREAEEAAKLVERERCETMAENESKVQKVSAEASTDEAGKIKLKEEPAGQQSRASEGKEGSVYYLPTEDDEDDLAVKGKAQHVVCKGINLFCVWDCCRPWIKFQKIISLIIFNPFVELFITLCFVANILFMALDHHNMDIDLERVLKNGNYFFTAIYTFEATMKLIAMSPKYYFQKGWNIFDFIIVVLSIIELALEGVQGLSVFRVFRLLRVFKLFKLPKLWSTMNLLIFITRRTIFGLANLTFVMFVILIIFAVIGMHQFGKNYIDNMDRFPDGSLPRWNFTDFMHSFMIVFRIFCGEWIESMWDCMLVSDGSCIPFFLAAAIIGNLVIVNLFLVLFLLNINLCSVYESTADQEANQILGAFNRICKFKNWITSTEHNKNDLELVTDEIIVDELLKTGLKEQDQLELEVSDNKELTPIGSPEKLEPEEKGDVSREELGLDKELHEDDEDEAGNDDSTQTTNWTNLRLNALQLIENPYFEIAIITTILISSIALALEDVNLPRRPVLQVFLYYVDIIFTVIFFSEMLIKWFALGCKVYFTNGWCWLDFVVVMVSLITVGGRWAGATDIPAFRAILFLRALRPLCVASRLHGMRAVVNALVQSIPSIFNVLLVCLIFWLVFAIMGVQLFAGKYYKCVDENESTVSFEIIPDINACQAANLTWENSKMNFDHVGKAYLSLLQVATFKGWIRIMNDAIDSREVGKQPIRETNIYMYLYFVLFIIFGSFITRNLFVAVIINNFNEHKKRAGGSLEMFMTEAQKCYYNTIKKMGSKKPLKAIPRPSWRPQATAFDIVTNKKFDIIMMVFIGLNMLTMTLDHYQQSDDFINVLDCLHLIFILIFIGECLIKLFALRYHYFVKPWNVFDFVLVVYSILGLVLGDLVDKYFVSSGLVPVVRLAKFVRLLHLVKGARGIKAILFTLRTSIPALFNICFLLFLVTFVYAIFGMSLFKHVADRSGLDDVYNFKTFGQSMILLFQMSTTAGWDGVLDAITNEDDCLPPDNDHGFSGNCGSSIIGITYLLSYLAISFLIIMNLYFAVILENYTKVCEDMQEGLTDDDYDMFYEIWQQFDPEASGYIKYEQLSDLLDALEPPLQIHKPNKNKIISMDIPICRGDLMFCVDILDALIRDFFGRKGDPIYETGEIGEISLRSDNRKYEQISSTLWRQREESGARLIQNTWRNHKLQKDDGHVINMLKDSKDQDFPDSGVSSGEPLGRQTAILAESDGQRVVIQSKSPSTTLRSANV